MKLKEKVDAKLAENANSKAYVRPRERALGDNEVEAPILGNFLPVHHIFTRLSGKLARDEVQDYIVKRMHGNVKLVETDLWVGPIPPEGLQSFEDEKKGLPKSDSTSASDIPSEIDAEDFVGFYWEDLDFTVSINRQEEDEKATVDDHGLPTMNQTIRVQGTCSVRQHPTMEANGKPLNVVYFKRVGHLLPHTWQQVTDSIFQGVAHLMEGPESKYFKGQKKSTVASNALSSVLCCSTDAAKKLVE